MYGIIHVYPRGTDDDGYYVSPASKPDPLTEQFTYEYFRKLYPEGRKLSAKAFLATEQRIPGLGNGVLQVGRRTTWAERFIFARSVRKEDKKTKRRIL